MPCEVCEKDQYFYEISYKPSEDMKVRSNFNSLKGVESKEKRYFCSNECLIEWAKMPNNWK